MHPHAQLLNALTPLLVRNYENVTISVNLSSYKVLAFRLVSVEQEVADDHESEYQESDSFKSTILPAKAPVALNITTITDPQDDDNFFFDNLCLLVEKGTSHIGERFGDWDKLLAIHRQL